MMFLSNKFIILSTLLLTLFVSNASAFDTKAQAAYVLDQTTGTVLLKKTRGNRITTGFYVEVDDIIFSF
jgi:D-alanyl-D-alanine carboxypeptidase